ncbi:hypothetical protein [Lapidilactobacillus wuchangensis]|uniref:hypothetical protein n=1 Tax=Lapidilactobacillus wuchangensis TaxID=2486001 RepID=UPI000F783768|nr:hypothetical protein [Lapidilactobacillus wuchangensis]
MSNVCRLKYYYQLNLLFPNPHNSITANGYFHVYGNIQANSLGKKYKIEFRSCKKNIQVIIHNFFIPGSLYDIPHIFVNQSSKEKKEIFLCLYRNKHNRKEFIFGDNLKETLIPWTKEWLYFYELFLVTGKWYGNGEHPE